MMTKYAKITDGVIVQVQPYPEPGFVQIPDSAVAGMIEQPDGSFAAPAPGPDPVPQSVTARQGRLQLLADGLLTTVEELATGPDANPALKIEWEYSTIWERDSAWIGQLGTALGLIAADLDRMFTEAAQR